MEAVFIELPAFERYRGEYFDDEGFSRLQQTLMADPQGGDVIQGSGGLRKLRYNDPRRGKGKRGGLRVIYYWWEPGEQFWLFTVFGKDEAADLTPGERAAFKVLLKKELKLRARSS